MHNEYLFNIIFSIYNNLFLKKKKECLDETSVRPRFSNGLFSKLDNASWYLKHQDLNCVQKKTWKVYSKLKNYHN